MIKNIPTRFLCRNIFLEKKSFSKKFSKEKKVLKNAIELKNFEIYTRPSYFYWKYVKTEITNFSEKVTNRNRTVTDFQLTVTDRHRLFSNRYTTTMKYKCSLRRLPSYKE